MVGYIASLRQNDPRIPVVDTSWLDNVVSAGSDAIGELGMRKSVGTLSNALGGVQQATQQPQGGFLSRLMGGGQQQAQPQQMQPQQMVANQPPVGGLQRAPSAGIGQNGSTFEPFINTVKAGGVTNPYALAAIAATGKAESGWSPENANRSWSDPSQSGGAGTAGGVMSWRNERLQNLYSYASSKGEQPNNISPETQAEFFLREDPQLIQSLNQARSPEEAASMMANAWRFAGYDQQGGEAGRRRALTTAYAAEFGGNGGSLGDMPAGATSADAVNAMGTNQPQASAYVDPMVSAPNSRQQMPVNETADASGNIMAPAVTPIQQGGVNPDLIKSMLQDPNLREMGMQLWQQNVAGPKATEAWQFVNLPDGTLARANQQTGEVQRVGNFAKPPEPKALINMGDGRLFDPNNREVIDAGGDRKKAPNIVELFDEQTGQPYKARWNEEAGSFERVGGVKAPNGTRLTVGPNGEMVMEQGPLGRGPKLTEAEGKNSGFLVRANDSQKTLNTLEAEGTSLWNNTAGKIPVAGNFLRSQDAQKYDQAKRDFINAQLRRESGAVISPEEFANAEQQYFPQPGDGPEVIVQKRRNRDNAIRGLEIGAGPGADAANQPQTPRQPMQIDGYTIQEVD